MPRRIRITLSYDGTDFHGWQIQPEGSTIQQVLEDVFSRIEGAPVKVAGSGRTDAGVHALAQVAAFTIENPIPAHNLLRAANRLLPPTIRILDAAEAAPGFHPRFDAVAKTYRYAISRSPVCMPFEWRYVHHYPYPLNEALMTGAAPVFEGEHDFRVFAASDERYKKGVSTTRTIFNSELVRSGDKLIYSVRGNGFLKHMVRNIVGTLIEIGRENIDGRNLPVKCGQTAPAKGLTLVFVEYPMVP